MAARVDGILCWDLDRLHGQGRRRRYLATRAHAAAAARRRAARLLRHGARRSDSRYTKYVIVDEVNLKHRGPCAAARGRQAILPEPRHHPALPGLRVSDSFLLQEQPAARFFQETHAVRTIRGLVLSHGPARHRPPDRLPGHATTTAGTDEGCRARHLSGRDARRHHPRRRRARRARWRAGTAAAYQVFSARHDLPRRRRSGRRLRSAAASPPEAGDYRFVAPDNGVPDRRCSTSTPPKRVVELSERSARGRPSAARSKGAIASRPRRRGSPKGSTSPRSAGPPARLERLEIPHPAGRRRITSTGQRAARRSLRQSDHQHRPEDVRDSSAAHARDSRRRAPGVEGRLHLCRRVAGRRSARCSAAPTISRSRPTARARRAVLDLRTRRSRACRPPRMIRFTALITTINAELGR